MEKKLVFPYKKQALEQRLGHCFVYTQGLGRAQMGGGDDTRVGQGCTQPLHF